MSDAKRLSRMLFLARESLEMWADVLERETGNIDHFNRSLIEEIDKYRADMGWSAYGFGGEEDNVVVGPWNKG